MKKILVVLTIAGIALAAFGSMGVTQAFAQTTTPPTPGVPQPGQGGGSGMAAGGSGSGILQNYMDPAIASVFGISLTELQTRINAGETLYQIVQSQGLTLDQFFAKLAQARSDALKTAVTTGTITQQTADWMSTRIGGRGQRNGSGSGKP